MADATLRGEFALSGEPALRTLRDIRDTGLEADAALESVGKRLDSLDRQRSSPTLELSGFDRVNAQLTELEHRLDRLDRRRVSSHVGISGGFSNFAGGGGGGGGVRTVTGGADRHGLFSTLGGIPGALPWWAAAAPLAPQVLGGAGALLGSAGAATLGAGAVGIGAAGTLGVGGALTMGVARQSITDLQNVTKAQTAFNTAVETYGRNSTQARTEQQKLNAAIVEAGPAAAGAARQVSGLTMQLRAALRPGEAQFQRAVGQGAYSIRRALPQLAPLANTAAGVTGRSAAAYVGFLTNPTSLSQYGHLTAAFATELPIIERSLQNVTRTFLNLSVAATPFFHEADVWVMHWTQGMAASSSNTAKVRTEMQGMVTAGKDWLGLAGALGRTLRDVFAPSVQPGNSMVVELTHTLDRWDSWLRNNPDKVRQFFRDGEQGVSRIATIVGNLTRDVWQLFQAVSPILTRAEQFIKFASGLGGGNLALGSALLYGGYTGVRGAAGGRGPSAGGALSTFLLGPSAFGGRAGAGAGAVGGGGALSSLSRASNAAVARGVTGSGTFLMGPATIGSDAVLARRAAEAEANIAAAERGALGSRLLAAREALGTTRVAQTVTRAAQSVPAALARDALATGTAVGRSFIAGAARFALPVLGINALLQGLQPTQGGAAGHFQNAVSGLTLGIVPPFHSLGQQNTRLAQQTLAQMPPGLSPDQQLRDLQRLIRGARGMPGDVPGRGTISAFSQAEMGILAQQAGRVTTPGAAAHVASMVAQVRLQLAPNERQRFSTYLTEIADTAAKNAGIAASNRWQDAFSLALNRGIAPKKAVAMMLAGMDSQLRQLKPAGQKALAQSTAAWVQQLEIANPQLRRPLEQLMNGIITDLNRLNHHTGTTMSDLQQKVFYFNGQIYTGMDSTWSNIWQNLDNKASRGQAQLAGTFQFIQQQAVNALTGMGFSKQNAQRIVTQASQGGTGPIGNQAAASAQAATSAQRTNPQPGGFSPLSPRAPSGLGKKNERGGPLQGSGMLDTLSMPDGSLAAPGEAYIANRHTMADLSRATLEKYGKTAWEIIRDEPRQHSSQQGIPLRYTGSLNRHRRSGAVVTSTGRAGGTGGTGAAGYVYGYAGVEPESRTDQGVDFTGAGPIYSIGSGRVIRASLWPGWPGTGGVVYQLDSGQYSGQNVYAMEHVRARVGVGQQLTPGQYIGDVLPGYPWLETGWANSSGTGPLTPYNGAADGTPMPGGVNFRNVLAALKAGGRLPAGVAGGGAGGAGVVIPQIHLRSPRSGLGGYLGAMVDQGGRIYAAGAQQRINKMIGASGMTGFAGTLSGSVENQVAQFMGAAGFNKIAIAGMLGNAMQESGMNPNTPGGGLWQQIANFGSGSGGSLLSQMQRMLPQIAGLRGAMNAAGSPGAAATIFEQGFERAGIPAMANRISAANAAYAAGYGRGGRTMRWGGWHRQGVDMTVDQPTLFGAGEGGRKERVRVTPAHTPTQAGHHIAVSVKVERLSAHPDELDVIGEHIGTKILEAIDRVGQGESDAALMGAGPSAGVA